MADRESLLINWLVYPAVGHALEAFKHAQGYLDVNQELDVHVLLPPTPTTTLAPKGITVHSIDLAHPAHDIGRLPREWDYVITDSRIRRLESRDGDLLPARTAADSHFRARVRAGVAPTFEEMFHELEEGPVLPYRRNSPLRLVSPSLEADPSRPAWSGLNVCILPAGSTTLQSPSLSAWRNICEEITSNHDDVTFHFTGRSGDKGNKLTRTLFGRGPATTSTAVNRHAIVALAAELRNAHVWWDCGFAQQLALISACDVLIAPHTGFAFLAGALGTPWLTLSCCRWPEYFFDPTPFHSIFPSCPSYPSLGDGTDCTLGVGQHRCLADLEDRGDEIANATLRLLQPDTTYEQCVMRHLKSVDEHPRGERFYFFDGRDSLMGHHVRPAVRA